MKNVSITAFLLFFSTLVLAQSIRYKFAAPNAAHHEAEISVIAEKVPAGPVYFRMSRSSPGRYAKHEFGKNVYNVAAVDGNGKKLPVVKTDADIYKVTGHAGKVILNYTLYANHADGTYASVDRTGFHLNMPATFMWVKGMESAPVSISFSLLNRSWKIATQLKQGTNDSSFSAPNLQYFMDSPTKIGDLQFRDWTVKNTDNKLYNFRLAFEGEATASQLDNFAAKLQRMVLEAKAVYGELPAFDYGTYTFIASINPYVHGDGMEHRNSTMITIPRKFDGSDALLGVFSHEFFHCWNVERIRPADLEPFNFEKSNMSEGLWVAEGFTQYYGDIILKRAGLISDEEFWGEMSRLVNTKMNTNGAQNYSPIENSQRAIFVDAGVAIDKTNYPNMYSSYYTYGGATAMALDLALRSKYKEVSLDNFMRELWKRFGKTGKPYTVAELQPALAAVSDTRFAADFFKRYVYGHEAFDFAGALQQANVKLQPVDGDKAWAGPLAFVADNDLRLGNNTTKNTPLYNSGADIDDLLLSLDGKTTATVQDVDAILNKHKAGDVVPVRYEHRGNIVDTSLQLIANPWIRLEPGTGVTSNKNEFAGSWLGSKISL